MEADRLNSPHTSAIILDVLGHQLQFSQAPFGIVVAHTQQQQLEKQDPNSKHLGTTVWDASMVLVKYLEKNSRKGNFCPSKLKGKRVVELGAGCGVAGFGMSLLGCDVISTDQTEVLPLLMRNVERNTSRIMQKNPDTDPIGSINVAELDWGNEDHIKALDPPFDFIIGTDVVYAEHLLEPLLQTILALSGPKTTILIGYEVRSTSVHEQMLQMWKKNFVVKTVPRAKMDSKYQHPSIQLFIMSLKPTDRCKQNILQGMDRQVDEIGNGESRQEKDQDNASSSGVDEVDNQSPEKDGANSELLAGLQSGKLSEWEARRYGSMAARLLRDVKIT